MVSDRFDVVRVHAEHLAVYYLGCQISIIRRDLTPAFIIIIVGAYPRQRDILAGEGFDAGHQHGGKALE